MADSLLFINGEWRHSKSKKTFDVINPQTRKLVTLAASAESEDIKDAVDAAHKAQPAWAALPPVQKRAIFSKAAGLLETDKYKEKATAVLREEVAAIDFWVNLNIFASTREFGTASGLATEVKGETFQSSIPGARVFAEPQPHGVVLAIAPWNAPLNLTSRGVGIPLICGNTVVLKGSEYSPRCHALIVELLHEAGLPSGVLNLVSVSREDAPRLTAELIGNPLVRHVNFTGSDRVGRILAAEAAKYLKPCVFELGGKAPAVVLDDANVQDAARAIAFGSMLNSGQICMSTERAIVQRGIADQFISALKQICQTLKAGDPSTDPTAKLACLFSEAHAENVVKMLKHAKDEGAEILLGDLAREGAVVQPHLLKGVKPGMRMWDVESFGPVCLISVVDTVDEAIELANASEYSLVASLWTNSISGIEIAGRIRAGCTSINGPTMHGEASLGHAGLGGATGYGRFDIEHFTVKRMIVVHPPGQSYPPIA